MSRIISVSQGEVGTELAMTQVPEDCALASSPIACAVADGVASHANRANFSEALQALELATRNSPLRKVRP